MSTPSSSRASRQGATTSPWRRTAARTLLVHCSWLLPPLASVALTALAGSGRIGTRAWITLGGIVLAFAAIGAIGLARWNRTTYRIADGALHLRTGVFSTRRRTLPLERIRTVDLTAPLPHRLLGLTVLRAGAAESAEITLNALRLHDAQLLRQRLLACAGRAPGPAHDGTLARIDWRWLRYAPLTFWVIGGVGVAMGTVYRILDGLGIELWRAGFVRDAFDRFGTAALWLTVPALLLTVLAVGALGSLALYVENWWGLRTEWRDAHTLSVRRGLLTTRSVTIERARLRGSVLREPMLLRAGGGAMVQAVAGGLGDEEEARSRGALLPPAPRGDAVRVAAGALRGDPALFDGPGLARHPRAALWRRVQRGLSWAVLPPVVALVGLGVTLAPLLLVVAAVYAPVASLLVCGLAHDAYRTLGHGLRAEHLVVRSGTFSRDTLVLQCSAVAAWSFTTSPFARRNGLVTLTAAVAAGEHAYRIPDMAAEQAVGFAAAAAPGIIDEYVYAPHQAARSLA
ncbi:PH domain-containing protein [Streptomyces sp. NPDC001941]|uniref:PH domain-containing protein n=1 Tax=Streptomyces sp. NPDC001941 TaxID=3154659 RepID=UPI00332C2BCD